MGAEISTNIERSFFHETLFAELGALRPALGILSGGALLRRVISEALLLPQAHPVRRVLHPAVHSPGRYASGAFVRRAGPPVRTGLLCGLYGAALFVAGRTDRVFQPVQNLSVTLLCHQAGHGGRGLWGHGSG